MSSALNKAPKSISPSFRARLYLPCPIICLASLRFAYTLPVGTCLTLVSILWCFNGFPQIRIQVLDNTKSGHFSHEKTTPQGGNYSFEICDLDGSGSISCIDHNRSIPSNKRFENTTVRGTSKIRNSLKMRSLRISLFFLHDICTTECLPLHLPGHFLGTIYLTLRFLLGSSGTRRSCSTKTRMYRWIFLDWYETSR